ncbi:hypothetical protein ACQEVB_12305 [Pseudonocardia sp. CA-107938]|uniref:hypothetical protein n=1 Tax=Pseudonocardia sp. CA-107938 TaxID=3240021 RepID=UPI003D9391E6
MRRARLLGIALLAVLLAGCGALQTTLDMSGRLQKDGFRSASVLLNSKNGHDVVTVRAEGHDTLRGDDAFDRAARIVWQELPLRFDELQVTIAGETARAARQDLEDAFGSRNPALDQRSIGQEIGGGFVTVGIVVLVVFVVGTIGIVLLVVWLVRRSQRRRASAPPWPPRPPYGGPPMPPGPPPAGLR